MTHFDVLIDYLIEFFRKLRVDWLIDWLFDCWIDWLIDWLNAYLNVGFLCCFVVAIDEAQEHVLTLWDWQKAGTRGDRIAVANVRLST